MIKTKKGSYPKTVPPVDNSPVVQLYRKQGKVKIERPATLKLLLGIAKSDMISISQKKKNIITEYKKENPSKPLTYKAKKHLDNMFYFSPPEGTVVVHLYSESWCYLEKDELIAYFWDLPFVGAVMSKKEEREIIVFAKAPTDHTNYNDYMGLLANELAKTGLIAHIVPVFKDTFIEIPYDPHPLFKCNWDAIKPLELPEGYKASRAIK